MTAWLPSGLITNLLSGTAFRLSWFYIAIFVAIGTYMPFWPVWLKDRGMNPEQIGLILSLPLWIKIFVNPIMAKRADQAPDRRKVIRAICLGAAGVMVLFPLGQDYWHFIALTVAVAVFYTPIMALSENLGLLVCAKAQLDYGRCRLWGSLSFIACVTGVGALLEVADVNWIVWLLVASLVGTALLVMTLPLPAPKERAAPSGTTWQLVKHPIFVLFVLTASFAQAGHAVYYGFGTLNWQRIGYGEATIGLLWAEGVVVEVALFAAGAWVSRHLGPGRLFLLAGLGGLVRWTALALDESLLVAVTVQGLHALTFGAAHLGAMFFIQKAIPEDLSARAMAIYSLVAMGLGMALGMNAAGWLYNSYAAGAYLFSAACSLLTVVCAVLLRRLWQRDQLTFQAGG